MKFKKSSNLITIRFLNMCAILTIAIIICTFYFWMMEHLKSSFLSQARQQQANYPLRRHKSAAEPPPARSFWVNNEAEEESKSSVATTTITPTDSCPAKVRRHGPQSEGMYYYLDIAAKRFISPDVSYVPVDFEDRGSKDAIYSMCYDKRYPQDERYAGVDWTSYEWPPQPPFRSLSKAIMETSSQPPLKNKVGWYGNLRSAKTGVPEYETRPLLGKIGEEYPELMDIRHTFVSSKGDTPEEPIKALTIPELVATYSILLDIGGNGYSGRLKYLLFSGRPLLLVDRFYVEWFHQLLVPWVHYIPVEMDLSNLIEQVKWTLEHKEEAQKIANYARIFAIETFTEDVLVNRAFYVARNIIDDRAAGMKHFLQLAADASGNPSLATIPIDSHEQGSDHMAVYTQSYDKRCLEKEKFCGVGSEFHAWVGRQVTFKDYTQAIMEAGNKPATYNRVSWCGHIYGFTHLPVPEGDSLPRLATYPHELYTLPSGWFCPKNIDDGMSFPELVRDYSILLDIGGYGFSEKLKFFLFSGRPILFVDRHYVEWYHTLLVPYKHYVPVEMDLGNLQNQTQWIMENKEEAQKISDNARAFAIETFTQDKLLKRTLYAANNVLASLENDN